MSVIEIPLLEYIELLEIKLAAKKEAFEKDSSWNYGIEEIELQIESLKINL